eukprot:4486275-Amphidinium_carterae.1
MEPHWTLILGRLASVLNDAVLQIGKVATPPHSIKQRFKAHTRFSSPLSAKACMAAAAADDAEEPVAGIGGTSAKDSEATCENHKSGSKRIAQIKSSSNIMCYDHDTVNMKCCAIASHNVLCHCRRRCPLW